jgi:hypothetical protein
VSDQPSAAAAAVAGSAPDPAAAAAAAAPAGAAPPAPPQDPAADRWQDKFLPADLRGDDILSRYKSIEDLAKGHVETTRFARGRVAVPGADATPEQFAEFAAKVRPADAAAYDISVPEGADPSYAEHMRAKFHEAGAHPLMVKTIVEANNQFFADQASRQMQAGQNEITALELEMGPSAFTQRMVAINAMLDGLGIPINDLVPTLEKTGGGAGATIRALMTLAEKTGELAKVDGASVAVASGRMTASQARDELTRMDSDRATIDKVLAKDAATIAKREALLTRIKKGD